MKTRKAVSYIVAVAIVTALTILALFAFWSYINTRVTSTVTSPDPRIVDVSTVYDTVSQVLTITAKIRNDGGSTAILQSIIVIGASNEIRFDPGEQIAPYETKTVSGSIPVSGLTLGTQVLLKFVFADGQERIVSSIVTGQ